ncbi:unnamed protein product [Ectocarpus sp. 6 AP-2014]
MMVLLCSLRHLYCRCAILGTCVCTHEVGDPVYNRALLQTVCLNRCIGHVEAIRRVRFHTPALKPYGRLSYGQLS